MYRSVRYRNAARERSSDVEDVEYYNNNIHLPIFSRDHRVLKPLEVMELLVRNKDFFPSKVCTNQPLQVEHHCTFVVDMNSLASAKDIKCDDMGVWVNSGCHKFPFKVKNEDSCVSVLLSSVKDRDSVFLKREYFKLKHDSHDDVRKRIDIIIRKFVSF